MSLDTWTGEPFQASCCRFYEEREGWWWKKRNELSVFTLMNWSEWWSVFLHRISRFLMESMALMNLFYAPLRAEGLRNMGLRKGWLIDCSSDLLYGRVFEPVCQKMWTSVQSVLEKSWLLVHHWKKRGSIFSFASGY